MPKVLEPGVLYYAEKFGAATHLCPCGCRHKVQTPVGPSDYSLRVSGGRPTLYPSIGNWQRPCRSHYWIRNGEIIWEAPWSDDEIAAGRVAEAARDRAYFKERARARSRLWTWLTCKIKSLVGLGQ